MKHFFEQAMDRGAFAPPASDTVAQFSLAAGVQQRVEVPAGARYVVYSGSGDFWALEGASDVAAAIGSAGTVGANAELNPTCRRIGPGITHISIIAAATREVSLSFYQA